MKYLVTKIPLTIDKQKIHQIFVQLHHIEENYNQYITYIDKGWIIDYSPILAYHIEDDWIYEYIYNEETKELYIQLDDQGYSEYINILDYLYEHDYIDHQGYLYTDKKAFYIESFEEYINNKYQLPIVYLDHVTVKKEKLVNQLVDRLFGMAYVIYGNEEFDKKMREHYHLRKHSYFIYLNQQCLKLNITNKEDEEQFIERVFMKVQNYTTTRVYEYPYSMNELYKTVLKEMINNEEENETYILGDLESEIQRLEEEREKLEDKINHFYTQISLLEEQNLINKQWLSEIEEYPLLLKGKEKEYYEGEQKDLVLFLLEEAKNGQDKEYKEKIDKILNDNPKVGKRDELIGEIEKILRSSSGGLSERTITKLSKCGVTLEKSDHYAARFFDDTRYLITIGSSPSDVQFANQVRRHVKKYFF